MKCPKCHVQNPEGLTLCSKCGAELEKVCPKCGFRNPPQFKFCGECGHDLNSHEEQTPRELSFDEKLKKIQKYLPAKSAEGATPYCTPRFSRDGKSVICYTPATSEGQDDITWLVDMTTGNKRRVTEGANPTFVFDGTSIVFERWLDRWSDSARSELLYLGLDRERDPERIFIDASEPSGW